MKKNKLIDKIILAIVSIQTILLGLLFIIQILRIYYGNDAIFTREICAEYIKQILLVIILWIVVIIGSYIYFHINKDNKKHISKISNMAKLRNLERVCPTCQNDELNELYSMLTKEENKRKLSTIISIVVIIICSFMGLSYMINIKHFEPVGELLLEQAIKMTIHLLPWVIITMICLVIRTIYIEFSARKSINIVKEIIKSSGKNKSNYEVNKKEERILLISRLTILTISVAFIIVGAANGQAGSVLEKAINICTECIGLG